MKKLLVLFCLLLAIPVYGQVRRIARSTFAALGTPPNDSVRYCTDCAATSPCTGSGSGASAMRVNGAWNCSNGGGGGGGTPGGSDTQVQRNNASAFGGISGATSNGTDVTFGSGNLKSTRQKVTTSIDDSNGNEVIKTPATGSAVNEATVTNSAAGQPVSISATGDDTNIGLTLLPKGTGLTTIGTGATVVTVTNAAAPSSPSSGDTSFYSDSTDLRLHDKNASGVIGTTVVSVTAPTNQFANSLSSAGALGFAQVGFTNISGTVAAAQNTVAVLDGSVGYCADAGSTDTYTCSLSPAPAGYVTGARYRFKANTANTGAATLNLNSLGAKTIKKAAGGITTDLADNDIRVGQVVELAYDGTNLEMQSTLGNAGGGSGTPGGSDTQVQYNNASAFGGLNFYRVSADNLRMRNGATAQVLEVAESDDNAGNYNRIAIGVDGGSGLSTIMATRAGTGNTNAFRIQTNHAGNLELGTNGSARWRINLTGNFYPSSDGLYTIGEAGTAPIQLFLDGTNTTVGTTGAQTINKATGTVNFAASATSLVVTNSLVGTASNIFVVKRTNDTTCQIQSAVPAAGSFTINMTAGCGAETSVGFWVLNQ